MLIFGRQPVLEALNAEKEISKIYILFGTHGDVIDRIVQRARHRHIPITQLPRQKFERLAEKGVTQGVVALIEEAATISIEDAIAAPGTEPAFFLALDGIEDPHNLGALIRTAECVGVHAIILPKHGSAPISDTVTKASAGATSHMQFVRATNLVQALRQLKAANVWIAGLDEGGDQLLWQFDGSIPICIIVGNEGKGLRPIVREACDVIVKVPMWGAVTSLNASVAGALLLYEVRRKRS